MIRSKRPTVSIALAVCALAAGCAWPSWEDFRESRAELERCEASHGIGAEECDAHRARSSSDYERYEREGRRAWGCDPGGPEGDCPTPR